MKIRNKIEAYYEYKCRDSDRVNNKQRAIGYSFNFTKITKFIDHKNLELYGSTLCDQICVNNRTCRGHHRHQCVYYCDCNNGYTLSEDNSYYL